MPKEYVKLHTTFHLLAFLIGLMVVPSIVFMVALGSFKSLGDIFLMAIMSCIFGGIPAIITAGFSCYFYKSEKTHNTVGEKVLWIVLTCVIGFVSSLGLFGFFILSEPKALFFVCGIGLASALFSCCLIVLIEYRINRKLLQ